MAVVLSESFAAGIPGGFATTIATAGALTTTYVAGAQAVDLAKDAFGALWSLNSCPASANMSIKLDLEQLAADAGFGTYSSIGAAFKRASTGLYHFAFISHERGSCEQGVGIPGDPARYQTDEAVMFRSLPSLAGRHTLEVCSVVAPNNLGRQTLLYVDGVLLFTNYCDWGSGETLTPAVWIRDSSYRLHSVEVNDAPALFVPGLWRRGQRIRHDTVDQGIYRVAGTVAIEGTPEAPARRRVRLLERKTARFVRETYSDEVTGAFSFDNVAMNVYLVISDDHTRYYNAVVADAVVPVL